MIIVRLKGGLGNQMFQYAAGRRLSLARGVPLKLDLSWFSSVMPGETVRSYQLWPFLIQEDFATGEEIANLISPINCLGKILRRLKFHRHRNVLREKHFHFDPRVLDVGDDVYLDGYWQSEKYFADTAETIRKDFSFNAPLNPANASFAGRIRSTVAVSVHIRRGDYVSSRNASSLHDCCQPEYYRLAAEYLASRTSNPHFFVFSDEIQWARENISFPYPTDYVDCNLPDKPYLDLRLMTLCRHHIIANSTFSWWGAWLCDSDHETIIIAPKRWFADLSHKTTDIIPSGWLRL